MKAYALPLLLIALPAHAGTEAWLDAYGGHALQGTANLHMQQDLMFGTDTTEGARFDPQPEPIAGLRMRVDFDRSPVGLGLDMGYERVHQPQANLHLVPIAFGVTLPGRLTLARSADLGSLHPTGMLGMVLTGVEGSVNVGTINSDITENSGGSGGRPGLQASLGLSWQARPDLAIFTEYRYQDLRFELAHANQFFATQFLETSGRIRSQAVLAGVSFRLVNQVDLPTSAVPIPEPAPNTLPAPMPDAAPDTLPAPVPDAAPGGLPEPAPSTVPPTAPAP